NADLTFADQQGVDPLLDIAAETRLRPATADPSAPLETITAQLSGRSSKPVISLTSSNPAADQRSILAALTVGRNDQGNAQLTVGTVANPLDNYFSRQLNSQLSADLSKFFNGAITDWELQRDQGGVLNGQG